jgi:hypothetical protein
VKFTFSTLAVCLAIAAAGTPPGLSAAEPPVLGVSARLSLQDFRTRGKTEDQRTDWELSGRDAQLDGPSVVLQTVEVTFRTADGETILITSPGCSFNRVTKIGASAEPLTVRSRRVRVDGVGYDIFAGQQKLHIRSQVVMHLERPAGKDHLPLDLPALRAGGNKNEKAGSKPVTAGRVAPGTAPGHPPPTAK